MRQDNYRNPPTHAPRVNERIAVWKKFQGHSISALSGTVGVTLNIVMIAMICFKLLDT